MILEIPSAQTNKTLKLSNVFLIPNLSNLHSNLISVPSLMTKGVTIGFIGCKAIIKLKEDIILATMMNKRRLYPLDMGDDRHHALIAKPRLMLTKHMMNIDE